MAKVIRFGAAALFVLCCNLIDSGYATSAPLSPSTALSFSNGAATSPESYVQSGHVVFNFFAQAGSVIDIGIIVTQFYTGPEYSDNDTMLFLFDPSGKQIAFNDDTDPDSAFQSYLNDVTIQDTGSHYIGVTTYDNMAVLDGTGTITGWQDIGKSNLYFIAYVTGNFIKGDFDGDNDVDGADFLEWQREFGQTRSYEDLGEWRSAYSAPVPTEVNSTQIPEPVTVFAIVIAIFALSEFHRRQHKVIQLRPLSTPLHVQ